jgi:hypothetical protein
VARTIGAAIARAKAPPSDAHHDARRRASMNDRSITRAAKSDDDSRERGPRCERTRDTVSADRTRAAEATVDHHCGSRPGM